MTKDAVLAILRKENDYISGEHISKLLGVSRAAVNTAVKALRAEGYEISSSTNKGYHLDGVPNSITAKELSAYLDAERMQAVECLDSVDSTNNRLRELALSGAPSGQVVLANRQTQGRGRRGRAFVSPQDNGIYLSFLAHPDCLPTDIAEITAWTAVATNNAIEAVCGIRAGIKWVNDLVIDRKKICGILTEMSVESEGGYIQYVIIGIGINVNGQAEDFPEEIRSTATSLAMETGKAHSRAQLAAALIRELDKMCAAWPKGKLHYLECYRRDNITTGKEITVVRGAEEIPAFATAIGEDFSLKVRYADGRSESLSSGEISIRGLYGEAENRN